MMNRTSGFKGQRLTQVPEALRCYLISCHYMLMVRMMNVCAKHLQHHGTSAEVSICSAECVLCFGQLV